MAVGRRNAMPSFARTLDDEQIAAHGERAIVERVLLSCSSA
jgi:hypothetical protein